ncbi:hypothetical protein EPR50_G00009670 [Perca flavescens]|uniref:Ribonuclease PIN domain-containing protein n=1 Tax=Perca flavescens TaxID=8167 RepID=A0A484DQ91_PERFV|nr:hypothetical protein EPR50_G00009670 [Perca flavescens]
MAPTLVAHVVADAGAFLKKASLQDIGSNIYTLRDVVDEIRDKPTRRSLAFLPYTLNFKEPHPEHIRLDRKGLNKPACCFTRHKKPLRARQAAALKAVSIGSRAT